MLILQESMLFWGHVALVLFNMTGWMFRQTRRLHLATFGLTAFSWFALGAVYGWGYCICTDYHADVLARLGSPEADLTFIQLMFQRLLGMPSDRSTADTLAVVVFLLICFATAFVWTRVWLHRRARH